MSDNVTSRNSSDLNFNYNINENFFILNLNMIIALVTLLTNQTKS